VIEVLPVDHIALALENLRGHHAKNVDMRALAIAGVKGLQELEAVELALIDDCNLNTATGEQLNRLGRLVNRVRLLGEDDDSYRLQLRAAILLMRCSGAPEQLYAIFALLVPGAELGITPEYPAKFRLSWIEPPLETEEETMPYGVILLRGKAGGVGAYFYSLTTTADDTFAFEGGEEAEIPWGDDVWGDGVWGGSSLSDPLGIPWGDDVWGDDIWGGSTMESGSGLNGFSDTDQETGGQLARIWFF
jgi:hypothetical protein